MESLENNSETENSTTKLAFNNSQRKDNPNENYDDNNCLNCFFTLSSFSRYFHGISHLCIIIIAGLGFVYILCFITTAADPNFSSPITNITVPVAREAVLTCIVHDLFSYKVMF